MGEGIELPLFSLAAAPHCFPFLFWTLLSFSILSASLCVTLLSGSRCVLKWGGFQWAGRGLAFLQKDWEGVLTWARRRGEGRDVKWRESSWNQVAIILIMTKANGGHSMGYLLPWTLLPKEASTKSFMSLCGVGVKVLSLLWRLLRVELL